MFSETARFPRAKIISAVVFVLICLGPVWVCASKAGAISTKQENAGASAASFGNGEKSTDGTPAPSLDEQLALADAVWAHAQRGDNISAGRGVGDALAGAEALLAANETERAIEYFRRLTVIAPMRVDFRFRYAGLCAQAGKTQEAKAAYQLVLRQAETDVMINTSAAFLGTDAYAKMPALSKDTPAPGSGSLRICFVGVPGTQQWLLHEIAARFQKLPNVDVCVDQRDFVYAEADRNGLDALVKAWREGLPWKNKGFQEYAASLGIRDPAAATDHQIIEFAKNYAIIVEGRDAITELNKRIEYARTREQQWNLDRLFDRFALSGAPRIRTLWVALIPQDVYSGGNNFLFGGASASSRMAIVSFHRFAAENTGETPKRDRLMARTYKQMLSSVGFLLNVQRCGDPMCARAYPASLAEHDAKNAELCDACRAGFAKALGHELAR